MSVEHLAVVLHHSRAKGTAKVVLLGIANHQGDGGSWPTITTLARYANVHPRNVQKAVAWLVSNGEVAVELQAGGTRDQADEDRPNRYDVTVTCPSWCDRSTNHRDTRRRQAHLGIGGGDSATPPLAIAPPPPVANTPPKPSLEPTPPSPPPLAAPCRVCGQGQARCQVSQAKWLAEDRHPYQPLAVLHATAGHPASTRGRPRRHG